MTAPHTGEIFAGLTALCWVISGICFESAGRRVGSIVVNVLRLSIALILLWLFCAIREGHGPAIHAPAVVWQWLLISGFLGFFVCDLCLFRALVLLGVRRSLLMMALAPVFAAALDYLVLRAPLSLQQAFGMVITLAGVVWVIAERPATDPTHSAGELRLGTALALIAAIMQACGAITAKIGMRLPDGQLSDHQSFDPFTATLIRVMAGWVSFIVLVLCARRFDRVLVGLRDRRAMAILTLGSIVGPVLGVVCFLAALQRVQSGVAQTIVATTPVLMLPISMIQGRDIPTIRSAVGACVAVCGVIVLCLG